MLPRNEQTVGSFLGAKGEESRQMADKSKIKVRYLGAFADAARSKEATYELAAPTLGSLIAYLLQENGDKFRSLLVDSSGKKLRGGATVLVNGERRDLQYKLSDGDEITLLTPIAGGNGLEIRKGKAKLS